MAEKKYTPEEGEAAILKEIADHKQRAADRKAERERGIDNQTHAQWLRDNPHKRDK